MLSFFLDVSAFGPYLANLFLASWSVKPLAIELVNSFPHRESTQYNIS